MIRARQRIIHMTVVGHPTNQVLLVLQPANHNTGIRPCECWGNNNLIIVAFLENATIGYLLESVCVCLCVCVCVCVRVCVCVFSR